MCLNFSADLLGWNVRPRLCEIRWTRYEVVVNAVVLLLHKNVNWRPLLELLRN